MAGTQDILAHAASLGISQSILSASKGSYLARAVVEYGIDGFFNSVQGLDNHQAAGKLDLARVYLNSSSLDPADILLVGDTTHDGEIARALGLKCFLIPNGHQGRTRLEKTGLPIINSLDELKYKIK